MQEEDRLTPAEEELAAALGRLSPTRPGIDRDRVLFLAGRAAGRRDVRLWEGAAAALAACLVVAVVIRPAPQALPRPANRAGDVRPGRLAKPEPGPAAPRQALVAGGGYARLRDDVLARGLAALPPAGDSANAEEATTLAGSRLAGGGPADPAKGPAPFWTYLYRRQPQ